MHTIFLSNMGFTFMDVNFGSKDCYTGTRSQRRLHKLLLCCHRELKLPCDFNPLKFYGDYVSEVCGLLSLRVFVPDQPVFTKNREER